MENKEFKNWNNFFLGILIMLVPFLLAVPLFFKNVVLVILGFLVALFSLANLGRKKQNDEPQP